MVICVECGAAVPCIYRRFPSSSQENIRLQRCSVCGATADKYVEYEGLLLFVELLLHKSQTYRHILFNRLPYADAGLPPPLSRLAVAFVLFESYTMWFLLHASHAQTLFRAAEVEEHKEKKEGEEVEEMAATCSPRCKRKERKKLQHRDEQKEKGEQRGKSRKKQRKEEEEEEKKEQQQREEKKQLKLQKRRQRQQQRQLQAKRRQQQQQVQEKTTHQQLLQQKEEEKKKEQTQEQQRKTQQQQQHFQQQTRQKDSTERVSTGSSQVCRAQPALPSPARKMKRAGVCLPFSGATPHPLQPDVHPSSASSPSSSCARSPHYEKTASYLPLPRPPAAAADSAWQVSTDTSCACEAAVTAAPPAASPPPSSPSCLSSSSVAAAPIVYPLSGHRCQDEVAAACGEAEPAAAAAKAGSAAAAGTGKSSDTFSCGASDAKRHADMLRWLLQNPVVSVDQQLLILSISVVDFVVYLFAIIFFTDLFLRFSFRRRNKRQRQQVFSRLCAAAGASTPQERIVDNRLFSGTSSSSFSSSSSPSFSSFSSSLSLTCSSVASSSALSSSSSSRRSCLLWMASRSAEGTAPQGGRGPLRLRGKEETRLLLNERTQKERDAEMRRGEGRDDLLGVFDEAPPLYGHADTQQQPQLRVQETQGRDVEEDEEEQALQQQEQQQQQHPQQQRQQQQQEQQHRGGGGGKRKARGRGCNGEDKRGRGAADALTQAEEEGEEEATAAAKQLQGRAKNSVTAEGETQGEKQEEKEKCGERKREAHPEEAGENDTKREEDGQKEGQFEENLEGDEARANLRRKQDEHDGVVEVKELRKNRESLPADVSEEGLFRAEGRFVAEESLSWRIFSWLRRSAVECIGADDEEEAQAPGGDSSAFSSFFCFSSALCRFCVASLCTASREVASLTTNFFSTRQAAAIGAAAAFAAPAAAAARANSGVLLVKYNYLAAAVTLSMFGKLGTLVLMAWEESMSPRCLTSLFTLTSNVLAVDVFLNNKHHAAAAAVVGAAAAVRALLRLAQRRVFPSVAFPPCNVLHQANPADADGWLSALLSFLPLLV